MESWSIAARRPFEAGGGACTLVVVPHEDKIRVCHHGTLSAAAELDAGQVRQLVTALAEAATRLPR